MTLKEIALRNLLRRKAKAAFVLAGLVIGVTTVVAIISFSESMTKDINHKLEKYGANILAVPRSENLSLSYGGVSLGGISFETEEILEKELAGVMSIKNARNIAAIGPMVLGVVRVDSNRVLMAGVDFKASRILKPWWKVNGKIPDENSLLIGAEAARILNADPGTRLKIKDRDFLVSGILEPTGSQDDQLIFTHLSTAQSVLGKQGKISMVEVAALCQACPIEEMVKQISEALPSAKVMAIQQVVKGRMETLKQFRNFSYVISGVVVLVGSLVVLVTMMGSVRERTEEIGIFRAIGFRRSHVMRIVFTEAGFISALAGIMGYVAGLGVTKLAIRFFTASPFASVPFNIELAGYAFLMSVLVGLLSSAYPALLAARMDPNEALRAL